MADRIVFALNEVQKKEGGLIFVAKNKFGNYVIKGLMAKAEGPASRLLIEVLRRH
jgi:hypothetical protein